LNIDLNFCLFIGDVLFFFFLIFGGKFENKSFSILIVNIYSKIRIDFDKDVNLFLNCKTSVSNLHTDFGELTDQNSNQYLQNQYFSQF